MTEDHDLSLEKPYQHGVRIPEPEDDPVYERNASAWEPIDWELTDVPEDVLEARGELAANLHYLHMTHLTVLGDIVSEEPDTDVKRVAAVLVDDRMRNVDAWGRYLMMTGVAPRITTELDEHINSLFDRDAWSQLASIILADVVLVSLYQYLDAEDDLIHRVLERDVEQAKDNIQMITSYLRDRYHELSQEEQAAVRGRVDRCHSWSSVFVDRYSGMLEASGVDPEAFAVAAHRNIDRVAHQFMPENR